MPSIGFVFVYKGEIIHSFFFYLYFLFLFFGIYFVLFASGIIYILYQ